MILHSVCIIFVANKYLEKMDYLNTLISSVNDVIWSYIMIALLIGCALWFTLRSRFVQFRMIGEMVRLLGDSAGKPDSAGE